MSEVEANEPSAVPAVVEEQTTSPEIEANAESETVEAVEETPSGEAETTEKDAPEKPKNRFQERISELSRRSKEAEQKAIEFEQRAIAAEQRLTGEPDEPFPTLEQFGYDEQAHQQAVMQYNARANEKAVQRVMLQQQQVEANEARTAQVRYAAQTFQTRASEMAEETPDFYQKVTNPAFQQAPPVQEAILFSENGPQLAYYLASNLDEAREINSLPPVMVGMKLAQISNKLARPPSVIPSKTPDPLSPVVPSGTVEKDPSDMTPKEYVAWRRKGRK